MFFFSLGTLVVTIAMLFFLIKLEADVKSLRDTLNKMYVGTESSGSHAGQGGFGESNPSTGFSMVGQFANKASDAASMVASEAQHGLTRQAGSAPESWDCSCGRSGNAGAFCPGCGAQRP